MFRTMMSMMSRCGAALAAGSMLLGAGSAGCAEVQQVPVADENVYTPVPEYRPEWRTSSKPNIRQLTVQITAYVPSAIRSRFEELAAADEKKGEKGVAAMFHRAAAASLGSGFLVAHATKQSSHYFVVTNRHVIEEADRVTISFDSGDVVENCEILYISRDDDLAVIDVPARSLPVDYGFAFASEPAHDRDAVIATGYPALGGEPSFQTTEGRVSNERFEAREDGEPHRLIQHTAPIDPGSSGGPLTTPDGKLVGVNTLKANGRDNVYFAVPASAVMRAVRDASTTADGRANPAWMRASFERSCREAFSELGSRHPHWERATQLVSMDLLETRGFESFATMLDRDRAGWVKAFSLDPLRAVRGATADRIVHELTSGGGVRADDACAHTNEDDLERIGPDSRVRVLADVGSGTREVVLMFDRGAWRVADVAFVTMRHDPHTPSSKAAPSTSAPTVKTAAPEAESAGY